jgi:hypothetical protein
VPINATVKTAAKLESAITVESVVILKDSAAQRSEKLKKRKNRKMLTWHMLLSQPLSSANQTKFAINVARWVTSLAISLSENELKVKLDLYQRKKINLKAQRVSIN